jgi:hypothetical protein
MNAKSSNPRSGNFRRGSISEHAHGHVRASDKPQPAQSQTHQGRRPTGTPLLLFTVVAALTFVGIARVESRVRVLALADEIGQLTREHESLAEHKRRLQTERAYLRHPDRIRARVMESQGMIAAPPERIQSIRLRHAESGGSR